MKPPGPTTIPPDRGAPRQGGTRGSAHDEDPPGSVAKTAVDDPGRRKCQVLGRRRTKENRFMLDMWKTG